MSPDAFTASAYNQYIDKWLALEGLAMGSHCPLYTCDRCSEGRLMYGHQDRYTHDHSRAVHLFSVTTYFRTRYSLFTQLNKTL